jgi:hypothetical protein
MSKLSIENFPILPSRVQLDLLLRSADNKNPSTILLQNLAVHCVDQSEYVKAEHCIDRILARQDVTATIRTTLAELWARMGNQTKCLEILRQLPASLIDSPKSLELECKALLSLNRLDEYQSRVETLSGLGRDNPAAKALQIQYYNIVEDHDKLRASCRAYLEKYPPKSRVCWLLLKAESAFNNFQAISELLKPELLGQYDSSSIVPSDVSIGRSTGEILTYLSEQTGWVMNPVEYTTAEGDQITQVINAQSLSRPEVRFLKDLIESAAGLYLSSLKHEGDIWFNFNPSLLSLTSWAVRLGELGHQEQHIHPSGWVSGVIYLQLDRSKEEAAGNIEFGYTNSKGEFVVAHELSPKEGHIILFPSYFEHRTNPYTGENKRISIAFDICLHDQATDRLQHQV